MRWRLVSALVLLIACGCAMFAYFRTPSSAPRSTDQEQRLEALKESPNSVIRDFANGVFAPGSAVADLTAKYPPSSIARHGPYTDVAYGERDPDDLWVFARDGRIYYVMTIGAGGGHCFFCTANEAELSARQQSFETYRLNNCFQAILGPAAAVREFPRELLAKEALRP